MLQADKVYPPSVALTLELIESHPINLLVKFNGLTADDNMDMEILLPLGSCTHILYNVYYTNLIYQSITLSNVQLLQKRLSQGHLPLLLRVSGSVQVLKFLYFYVTVIQCYNYCIVDKPKIGDLLKELYTKAASKWEDIGLVLEIEPESLESLKTAENSTPQSRLREMLKKRSVLRLLGQRSLMLCNFWEMKT